MLFEVGTSAAAQGDALFRGGAPADRAHAFDSIPADRVIIDPQTVRPRYDRAVVQRPFGQSSRYHPGRDHLLQARLPSTAALAHREVETRLAVIESKSRRTSARSSNARSRKAEAAGEEWVEPEKENPFAYKFPLRRHQPRKPSDDRFRLPAGAARLGAPAADANASKTVDRGHSRAHGARYGAAARWYIRRSVDVWPEKQYALTIPEGRSPTSRGSPTTRSSAITRSSIPRSSPR